MHDDHRRALAHDLPHLLRRATAHVTDRRRVLRLFGLAGLAPLIGCVADGGDDAALGPDADPSVCEAIPSETAGPYPGDGTNGANALALAGIVRSDITTSLGGATGVAAGVPLTVTLTVVDAGAACGPLAGAAVYLWHCDADGNYSMYSSAVASESYLRGVQQTDADGLVTFTTIVPGCYSGRWPHIHFEVYRSLAAATNGANAVHTSQLALPSSLCDAVYATSGYPSSAANLARISLSSDNVFSDGASLQLASTTGSLSTGYTATLRAAVP